MKKITIIGVVVAVLLVGVLSTIFLLNRMAPKVQQDAQQYIDSNLPKIVQNWDSEALINQASPDLLKVASREQFAELFKMLSEKLGPLKQYKGCKGKTSLTTSFRGILRNGVFEAKAVFANAPAMILCRIVWLDGTWKINEFRVKSELLSP